MRDAPTAPEVRSPSANTGQSRRWAVVSVLAVLLVLAATLLARAVVAATARPTVVAAPALPALDAIAVAHPEAGAPLFALDAGNGHLLALAVPAERFCPPVGPCPAPPAPNTFVVLDGHTGQALASTPLGGDPAAGARALLVDAASHLACAVAPQAVTIFSSDSGARVGGFTLPSELGQGAGGLGAALDPADGTLIVTSGTTVVAVRLGSGEVIAHSALAAGDGAALLDGPLLDQSRSRIYLLLGQTDSASQPQVVVLDAHSLQSLGRYALPAGARLGPLDAADANLAVFGADGTTWHLPLDALANGQLTLAPVPALRNALALGENPALGHLYVADASATRVLAASGQTGPIGALPLAARGSPSVPLLVDTTRGLLYLPAEHGGLVIVQDTAAGSVTPALSPTAAVLLARAAFWSTWSDGQDPPFYTPATFPVQAGSRPQDFWDNYPNHGWLGPFAGQASTRVMASAGGGYQVTFTLAWPQLFAHEHNWVWAIAPDGGARLASSSGDALP